MSLRLLAFLLDGFLSLKVINRADINYADYASNIKFTGTKYRAKFSLSKRLIILGTGGHGLVAADCAMEMGCFVDIVFLDSLYPDKTHIDCWSIIGKPEDAVNVSHADSFFFVAIGPA